ncbi:MAG: murein biosynthesis integral membrane protein MurJ [Nitriliruptoraceae bacterium]
MSELPPTPPPPDDGDGDGDDHGVGAMRRNSTLIAAGIALSRVSGLLRDVVLAFFLGANVGADAFRAALKIPNLLQNLLGEGVLSASFIPSYSRLLAEEREEDAGRLAGAVLGLLTVLIGILVLLGMVLAGPLVRVLTPGFSGERLELTVLLVRIMFPGIGFMVLSAWCLGVLNAHRRFFLSYVAPVLWNLGILVTLVSLALTEVTRPAVAAGIGVVVGGAAQLAVQLPRVRRVLRGTLRVSLDRTVTGVRTVLRAFGPVVLGRGALQVAALVELAAASLLAVGAVAVLGYAQTLYLLPIALFGMSVAAAELPELSTLDARGRAALTARLDTGLARSAFFALAATVGYLVVGTDLVTVLFGRGAFDAETSFQVAVVLGFYSLGLVPATASRLLQSVLYAEDDTRTPALYAVARVAVALTVAVPLMLNLDRLVVDLAQPAGFALAEGARLPTLAPVDASLRAVEVNQLRLGTVGLAIGNALGSWVEYLLLRRAVGRRTGSRPRLAGGTGGRLTVVVVALVVLVPVVAGQLPAEVAALPRLVVVGGASGLVYLLAGWLLRVPEAEALLRRVGLRRRPAVSR